MAQQLRVHAFGVSLDGFGAGPDQSLEHPLGVRGQELHEWFFPTRTFQQRVTGAADGGETGLDDDLAARGFERIGATIVGRNMFGPARGPWLDDSWRGWWGDNPPFHHPVFVLTNHPRDSFSMEGGTTFHFVTDGAEIALARALEAADGLDVRLGGGVSTIQQYLRAGLVDYLHLVLSPTLLGSGERLFDALPEVGSGYRCSFTPSETVVHAELVRA